MKTIISSSSLRSDEPSVNRHPIDIDTVSLRAGLQSATDLPLPIIFISFGRSFEQLIFQFRIGRNQIVLIMRRKRLIDRSCKVCRNGEDTLCLSGQSAVRACI
jgi:hypothetical protein